MRRMEQEDSFPTTLRQPDALEAKASIGDELLTDREQLNHFTDRSKDSFLTKIDSKAVFDPDESVSEILKKFRDD